MTHTNGQSTKAVAILPPGSRLFSCSHCGILADARFEGNPCIICHDGTYSVEAVGGLRKAIALLVGCAAPDRREEAAAYGAAALLDYERLEGRAEAAEQLLDRALAAKVPS
jgi:hypothetical protein